MTEIEDTGFHLESTGDPLSDNPLLFSVTNSTINVSGSPPFVCVTGIINNCDSNGTGSSTGSGNLGLSVVSAEGAVNFTATGSGTVAGIEGIAVKLEGEITGQILSGAYTMGTEGGLPGGMAIVFHYTCDLSNL